MTSLKDWMVQVFGVSAILYYKMAVSVLIILIFWLLRRMILYFVNRRVEDVRLKYRWRKSTAYIAFFFGFLFVAGTWMEGVRALSTFLGLLSAGLAIALREPIVNLAGWGFLIWRRPFEVGDRVQIGQHQGDVIDIRIFQFSMLEIGNWVDADQSTGRIINIPNGKIFTEPQANYTKGFAYIWDEVPILITFESDWRKARGILEGIGRAHAASFTEDAERQLRKAAARYMIFYRKLTPIVYTSVKDSGVMLTIRYLVDPRSRRGIQQAIWHDVLTEFAQHSDIDFAYPTVRYYDNRIEGKGKAE